MLSRIQNIVYGVEGNQVGSSVNWNDDFINENRTDQKIRLVAKVLLWAVVGAVACLIPGLLAVGKPGLYWTITFLGNEVWAKLIPPVISMIIGATAGSMAGFLSWHCDPNDGIIKC